MKDTVVAEIQTARFGKTLFVVREGEGYIKHTYPVTVANNQIFLATALRNKGIISKRIEIDLKSSAGKKLTLDIPVTELERHPHAEGFLQFCKVVSINGSMPRGFVADSLAFDDLNFEDIDDDQRIEDLSYEDLLEVADNVQDIQTNIMLSESMSEFRDDYEWASKVLSHLREINLKHIDASKRNLLQDIGSMCEKIVKSANSRSG